MLYIIFLYGSEPVPIHWIFIGLKAILKMLRNVTGNYIVLIKDNVSTAHNMLLAIFVCKDNPISKTKFTYNAI